MALLVVCAVAFGVRVYPAHTVVFPEPGEVRLLGLDSYYHFRHAEYAAESFPHIQRWDLGTHYPIGQRSDAAGLYDLAIAAIAVVLDGGEPQRSTVLAVSAWIVPVLGTLGFVALFGLVGPALGWVGALLACVLYLLSPSHAFIRTALGFADHHAAEILLAVLSAAGLSHCLRDGLSLRAARGWWHALVGALPMAIFLFTWVGAPIFLVVLAATAGLLVLAQVAVGAAPHAGTAVFRYALALGVCVAVPGTVWPDLYLVPWLMDRLLIACGALAAGPLILERACGRVTRRGIRPTRVALGAIALGAGAFGLWVALDPESATFLGLLFGEKTLLIREHHVVTPQHFWIQFGPAGVAACVSIPIAFATAWRRRDPVFALPVLFGALLVALWVQTRDYGYLTPPFVAAMAATAILAVLRAVAGSRLRVPVTLSLVGLLAFPIWPADGIRRPYFAESQISAVRMVGDGWWKSMRWLAAHARPLPFSLADPVPRFHRVRNLHRAENPRYPAGSYGVLCAWEFGGFVSAIARRPAVWSRGSDNDPTSAWLVGEVGVESFDSVESMCRNCESRDDIRYVVVDARSGADFLNAKLRQVGRSKSDYYTTEGTIRLGDRDVPHWGYAPSYHRLMLPTLYLHDGRGLGHLRLVYESEHQTALVSLAQPRHRDAERFEYSRRAYAVDTELAGWRFTDAIGQGNAMSLSRRRFAFDAEVASSVKIFERVDGARLVGAAPPGARSVVARLPLRARTTGREFEYETHAPVMDGRFELVVPYATSANPERTEVVARSAYRLAFDTPEGEVVGGALEVSAAQVEQGLEVEWLP